MLFNKQGGQYKKLLHNKHVVTLIRNTSLCNSSGLYPLRWVLRLAISQFHKCSAHTDNDSFWDPLPLGLTPPFGRLSLGRKIRASRSVLRAARARFALRAQFFLLKTYARPMCINSQNLNKIRSVVQLRASRSFLRAARARFALRAQFFLLKTYARPMCINSQNLNKIRSVVQLRASRSFLRAARARFALRAQFFLLKTYARPMCINSQNLNKIRSVVQEEIANNIRTKRFALGFARCARPLRATRSIFFAQNLRKTHVHQLTKFE